MRARGTHGHFAPVDRSKFTPEFITQHRERPARELAKEWNLSVAMVYKLLREASLTLLAARSPVTAGRHNLNCEQCKGRRACALRLQDGRAVKCETEMWPEADGRMEATG